MNLFEIIILTLAISLSVFPTALASNIDSCLSFSKSIKTSLLFALLKGGFLALGYWICSTFSHYFSGPGRWIASGIFLLLAVKMIFQSLKMSPDERAFRLNNNVILFFSGIAVNIDGLIAGLGFAFVVVDFWTLVLFVSLFTFLSAITGIWYGKKVGNLLVASKVELTGGLILLGYVVFVLFRFLQLL